MANVRDSDTSLWLHNKLGTSNDSWISGSICSQLNKEVLRNIKECFPDLQTQVKLKLLLSFFHIPRRLVDEWKAELEEVFEVAGLDSELWVSMLAETMKTFPATSSLNTEISDYEDTRPIFTDMVNDLRKLVSRHSDLGMLPLECQYLNKNALVSVVGQQQNPVKHFTLKRKPKSANLRTELLHKSADAQSSLKKASAPTIPLRSRGMPRKMTDTTPLKGIPSRMPTSGFRSPNVPPIQTRPNMSRTPAGRKDGGIKLIEFTEQPLGYAAAKKRKRQQEQEEQQKKALEQKNTASTNNASNMVSASGITSPTSSPTALATSSSLTTTISTNSLATESALLSTVSGASEKDMEISNTSITSVSITPDYAPTLTYTQPLTPAVESNINAMIEDSKSHGKLVLASISSNSDSFTSNNALNSIQTIASANNNRLNNNTGKKYVKEEIEIKSEEVICPATVKVEHLEQAQQPQQHVIIQQQPQQHQQKIIIQQSPLQIKSNAPSSSVGSSIPTMRKLKMEKLDIKPIIKSNNSASMSSTSTSLSQQQLRTNPLANLPNNISVKITSTKTPTKAQATQKQQHPILINSSTPVILSPALQQLKQKQNQISSVSQQTATATTQTVKSLPLSQLKSAANSGPVIISQTIIQPAKRTVNNIVSSSSLVPSSSSGLQTVGSSQQQTKYILTSSPQSSMPSLSSFTQSRSIPTSVFQSSASTASHTPTKIVLKTSSSSLPMMMTSSSRQANNIVTASVAGATNPPPLISTQQPTLLNIQNVNLPNRPVTIQPASQAAQQQHLQAQLQQQQQMQHTVVSNTNATQQPKLTQVVMQSSPSNPNVKNKTIILTQKGVILRNIGGDMYQQIPISNVSGLQSLSGTTLMTTGTPGLVKTATNAQLQQPQQQTIQIQQQPTTLIKQQTLPTLIPTNTITPQHVVVQQQQPQQHQQTVQTIIGSPPQQTIIRPVMTNVQGGITTLPQGLTLIQRPGQQPQLVQVQTTPAPQQQTQIHRTIITQPQNQAMRPQQIILQQKPQQHLITAVTPVKQQQQQQQQQSQQRIQVNQNNSNARPTKIVEVRQQSGKQQQQPPSQQPQRKGLILSDEYLHKAHELFRNANIVSRPDKALIIGFMAGLRENPRPNFENVIVIKLGKTEEKVQQEDGTFALCLVESLIRLDYNTGEWKTFQNYRRLDQNSQGQTTDTSSSGSIQTQNSVVI